MHYKCVVEIDLPYCHGPVIEHMIVLKLVWNNWLDKAASNQRAVAQRLLIRRRRQAAPRHQKSRAAHEHRAKECLLRKSAYID
jgi:hypothetical protein